MRRISVEYFRYGAHDAIGQMAPKAVEDSAKVLPRFCRAALDPDTRAGVGSEKPGPDGALVIGCVPIEPRARVTAFVIRVIGRQRAQSHGRQKFPPDRRKDFFSALAILKDRVGQRHRDQLVRTQIRDGRAVRSKAVVEMRSGRIPITLLERSSTAPGEPKPRFDGFAGPAESRDR